MAYFGKGRGLGIILYSPITLVFLTIIVAFLARSSWGVYTKYSQSRAAAAQSLADLTALEKKQKSLSIENKSLLTEKGVESEIRQRYSVSKQNEEVFVIVDDHSASTTEEMAKNKSWWADIKALFNR